MKRFQPDLYGYKIKYFQRSRTGRESNCYDYHPLFLFVPLRDTETGWRDFFCFQQYLARDESFIVSVENLDNGRQG